MTQTVNYTDSVNDLHKDARGVRMSREDLILWDSFTEDEKQSYWDMLVTELMPASVKAEAEEAAAMFQEAYANAA